MTQALKPNEILAAAKQMLTTLPKPTRLYAFDCDYQSVDFNLELSEVTAGSKGVEKSIRHGSHFLQYGRRVTRQTIGLTVGQLFSGFMDFPAVSVDGVAAEYFRHLKMDEDGDVLVDTLLEPTEDFDEVFVTVVIGFGKGVDLMLAAIQRFIESSKQFDEQMAAEAAALAKEGLPPEDQMTTEM